MTEPAGPPTPPNPPGTAQFSSGATTLMVDFNPVSLRVALTNQFGQDPPQQHARPTSAKLDVEVIFDTTQTGADVRNATDILRRFATATGQEATQSQQQGGTNQQEQANHSLDLVTFTWGTSSCTGVIESLTETLDYWSSDGVPLRATVQVSMKGEASAFFQGQRTAASYKDSNEAYGLQDFVPAEVSDVGAGVTDVAGMGGDTKAGRALAAANGIENMRAPGGASLSAGAGISLSAAAGFSMSGGISAGASAGFGIGVSAGASASAGIGASVGIGMSAGAGFGASAGAGFGASAGAGFGASAGASFGASASAGFGASAGASFGASAGASFGASAGASFGASASAGFGASAGASFGASAGAGLGAGASFGGSASGFSMTSATSVTGFDGITSTQTSFSSSSGSGSFGSISRSASAGVSASEGAFFGLGVSKTTLPSASFDPSRLLPPPMPRAGPGARFDSTGKLVSSGGQVAASYSAQAGVTFF
jgi:hypothetical protein